MLPDYRVRQRDYLLEIIRALTQQLDLETVLARILEAATEMLYGQAGLVALRDDDGVFRVRIQYRVAPEFVRHFDSILRDAPDRGDPARFVISEIERRLVAVGQRFDLSGTVGLPLQAGEDLVGLLLVFRAISTPFGPNERQVLQAFTDQAAIAVSNARLFEQTANERRRLDAILEGSADGIAITDPGHHVQRWNRALARITGTPAADAVGNRIICESLKDLQSRIRRYYVEIDWKLRRESFAEHKRIFEAIRDRDADRAEKLTNEHLDHAESFAERPSK